MERGREGMIMNIEYEVHAALILHKDVDDSYESPLTWP